MQGKQDIFRAGETPAWTRVGRLMSEKGMSTRCGRSVVPDATMVYGALRRLQGYLMLQPRPKNTPSPGRHSWSGSLPVWLLPMFAP